MRHLSQIIVCFLLVSFAQSLYGQEVYQGMVYVRQNQAQLQNDILYLEMDINIHGLKVNDRESLSLYPILFNGTDSIQLAPIVLNGKKIQQKANRAIILYGSFEPQKAAYAVLKNDPLLHQVVVYRDTLSFMPWMKNAGLKLTGHVKNQDEKIVQTFTDILTTKINLFD